MILFLIYFHLRIIINKYKDLVYQYEKENRRVNIKIQRQFVLLDFYSETDEGKPRYMILIEDLSFRFNDVQFISKYGISLSL
jgi:hypothetical protein